jgi:hypothetical protein
MKQNSSELTPCPHIAAALQQLADETAPDSLFVRYVRKHVEKCNHCRETLEALKCYHEAIKAAYTEAFEEEGQMAFGQADLTSLLAKLKA